MDNRQLLCTFTNLKDYKKIVPSLTDFYNIYKKIIYVFSNEKNKNEIFLTYNIINEKEEFPKFPNTISIHRKKLTNSLFTLNALNSLIKEENNGDFDKSTIIQWDLYKNSLIITGEISVRIIPIKIHDVIKY
jgi:hypothetical protein